MSRQRPKKAYYKEYAAGILTELSLAVFIFAAALAIIIIMGRLLD